MIRTILLLFPIYVTLFWSIALAGNKKKHSAPRQFLGRFMLFPLIIYISHLLYFAPYPEIYPYFDVVLQCASLLVFPIYYIYFRLLTVDEKFSFRAHIRFLIIPIVVSMLYGLGVLFTPKIEFRTWLFNENAYPESIYIHFLSFMRQIIRIIYLIQVLVTVSGNYLLIRKYGAKAEQFYSDMQDGKYNNARMLNYSIIVMGATAFTYTLLGRHFLVSQYLLICVGWSIFSAMLFIIGYMGITQKPINPTFELITNNETSTLLEEITTAAQKKILNKLLFQFEKEKIYLNSQLNIIDVVQAVGTNRSYLSAIINQNYNQNFCTFVNGYRIEEIERILHQNPNIPNEMLAEKGGFGSMNSMKRAISSKTGMSFTLWKKKIQY
jgi:AraC-like DNA-binding protein